MLQSQKIQTLNHLDSQWELKTEEGRGTEVQGAWEAFWWGGWPDTEITSMPLPAEGLLQGGPWLLRSNGQLLMHVC